MSSLSTTVKDTKHFYTFSNVQLLTETNQSRLLPAVLLLKRLKVRVGLVARRHSDGDLWVSPDGGLVVGAGVLVQSVPLVLAAEPVVAGPAAVDVAALRAVERAVKVPHNVKVTPVEQSPTKTFITRVTVFNCPM